MRRMRLWKQEDQDRKTFMERFNRMERTIETHRLYFRIGIALLGTFLLGITAGLAEPLLKLLGIIK